LKKLLVFFYRDRNEHLTEQQLAKSSRNKKNQVKR